MAIIENTCKRTANPMYNLLVVLIDDCCKLRRKIQAVLGMDIAVKLDLFHAVQRITRTISRKCDVHFRCTQDLTQVFRADGDSEVNRKCSTPGSAMILSKMEAFSNKWINVKDEKGVGVFTQETIHAISNLKKHVSQGCLSDIPIGGGTNRNERFHHHINSILHRNKIGILLAYALLTVVIHLYNSAKTVKSKILLEPICNSRFRHDPTCEPLQPIGILPKDRQTDTQCEIDVSSCMVDFDEVKVIYLHALTKFHILTSLKYMGLVKLGGLVKHFASNSVLEQGCSADVSFESQLSQTLQSKLMGLFLLL